MYWNHILKFFFPFFIGIIRKEKSSNVVGTQHWSQPPHSGSDSSLGTTGAFVPEEDGGLDRKRPTAKAGERVVRQEWMDDYSRLPPPIFPSSLFWSRSFCMSLRFWTLRLATSFRSRDAGNFLMYLWHTQTNSASLTSRAHKWLIYFLHRVVLEVHAFFFLVEE